MEYITHDEVVERLKDVLLVQSNDSEMDPWVVETVKDLMERIIFYININSLEGVEYDGLPLQLYWIVKQATLNVYNRQLAEGAISHTENGEMMMWSDPGYDPLDPYYQSLNDFIDGYSRRNTFEFF